MGLRGHPAPAPRAAAIIAPWPLGSRSTRPGNHGGRAILRRYSTADVELSAKVAYWNDLNCNLFSPLEVTPADRYAFDAETVTGEVGPISIACIRSLPARVEHTESHVACTTTREFYLVTPIEGRMFYCHYGRDIVLEEGDFMLGDNSAPSRLVFHEPNRAISVVIPESSLRSCMPVPERVCGLHMSGRGVGSIASAMVRALWQQVERGLAPDFGPAVARHLLDVVATSYAVEYSGLVAESAVTSSRRVAIKRYVEKNLREPRLTPAAVARHFGVSPRYVRMIFASGGENLSAYILRRRLEECAQQLISILWSGQTIAQTASSWGFTSMAHFTRAFKERFGVTPRQYRKRHADAARGGNAAEPSGPQEIRK